MLLKGRTHGRNPPENLLHLSKIIRIGATAPVARARHNRDHNGGSEPALDLLEKYLKHGSNHTAQQAERWGGDYPLTVLEEAMKRIAPRFVVASSRELADRYPKSIALRSALENILRDIGMGMLDFEAIRSKTEDFALTGYGVPAPAQAAATGTSGGQGQSGTGSASGATGQTHTGATQPKKTKAVSLDDPRSVTRTLRQFSPKGNGRDKVVTLLTEAQSLKLDKQPHAFCFVLRSMFEISAKAYCSDHAKTGGPMIQKAGQDRPLVDVLRDITNHLTTNKVDKPMMKVLHGAMAELAKQDGFLSVTSMNQLVHNPKFSVNSSHISTLFGNIFPLLEAMNS